MKIPGIDNIIEMMKDLPEKTDQMHETMLRVEDLLIVLVAEVKKFNAANGVQDTE